jgi:hypothetical protein
MKPIIGEISYKDVTPEDMKRFQMEAEKMRAAAIRSMFSAIGHGIASGVTRILHSFRNITANPGIHPSAGTR